MNANPKYILMLLCLFCSACGGNGDAKDQRKALELTWAMIFPVPVNVLQDMGDGRLGVVTTKYPNDPSQWQPFAYIKRCLQGQIYRSVQNDCKGTGSASDIYGATPLQYCSSDIGTTCSKSYSNSTFILDGSGTSGFYNSCASDNFLSRKWLPMNDYLTVTTFEIKNISDYAVEFPLSQIYWTSESSGVGNTAIAYSLLAYPPQLSAQAKDLSKLESHLGRCYYE